MSLSNRIMHAWNAFCSRDSTEPYYNGYYGGSYNRPDRIRMSYGNEKSIVTSVYNRIALDVASLSIQHVRLDENGRYVETIKSGLNEVLTVSSNVDQTSKAFIQDIVMSMFDEGCIAIVPVDTTFNPKLTNSYDILSMRTGKVVKWYPDKVAVKIYNEATGEKEEITLPKSMVAIVENPLYSIMNETNSTLQRLIRKLNILDAIDEQSGSGKLDIIMQLPYAIKSEERRRKAEERRADMERQLAGSKYGIAYADSTEKITQLNRPAENNLMGQIEYLTNMLYSQLGFTESIFDGTADEKTMLNYYNRSIDPIVSAIVSEMHRKFLTKTARTQNQAIIYFRDPFKLVPVNQIADIADKFTRNEILSSNEVRSIIGMKPSKDPRADELRNKNLNAADNPKDENTLLEDNKTKGEK